MSIPESFHLSPLVTGIFRPEGAGVRDPAFDIAVQFDGVTKSKFELLVHRRRAELSEPESESIKVLKLDKALSDTATLFRVQEVGDAYFSELYLLLGTAMVKVRLESFRNGYIEAEGKILELAKQIKERNLSVKNDEIGFCIGPLVISSKFSKEYANFIFRDNFGLTFNLEIDTYAPDEPVGLISRMSGEDSLLRKFQVNHTVLRARERTVADMRADEWLGVGDLGGESDQRTLKFTFETKRKIPDITRPSIMLTFDSAQPLKDGTQTQTEISDKEAIELWDRVVDSIQVYH